MIKTIPCDKCGTEMRPLKEGYTVGMTCPRCGWGWVTTQMEAIDSDTSQYTLKIVPSPSKNLDAIRAISGICACNFIEARAILEKGYEFPPMNARETRKTAGILSEAGVGYRITPEFPYAIPESRDFFKRKDEMQDEN